MTASPPPPDHEWVVAATVPVDRRSASRAQRRGNLRVPTEVKVEALSVYCNSCRRSFDEVADEPCDVSPILHGGPIGTRKKRGGQPCAMQPGGRAALDSP